MPVTVMVRTFSPSVHVAEDPFSISVSPRRISTSAVSSVGVAVTLFVAFVVVAVYSNVSEANVGVSVTLPIVSPERELRFLPLRRR